MYEVSEILWKENVLTYFTPDTRESADPGAVTQGRMVGAGLPPTNSLSALWLVEISVGRKFVSLEGIFQIAKRR